MPHEPQSERDELEFVAELFHRQGDMLFDITAHMLAATTLDDRLSLLLAAVTSELGYSHATVALVDQGTGAVRIRMADGFPNEKDVKNMIVPGKFASTVPLWIQSTNGGHDCEFRA